LYCSKELMKRLLRLFFFFSHYVSISPTFYDHLFIQKCFAHHFSNNSLALYFAIFWQKNIGAKAAREMLVKMTTCVNFINVLKAAFVSGDICRSYRHTE